MAIYENKRLGVSLEIQEIRFKNIQPFIDEALPIYHTFTSSWVNSPGGKRSFDSKKAMLEVVENRALSALLNVLYVAVDKRNGDGSLDKQWLDDATADEVMEVMEVVVAENAAFLPKAIAAITRLLNSTSTKLESLAA